MILAPGGCALRDEANVALDAGEVRAFAEPHFGANSGFYLLDFGISPKYLLLFTFS
jgi:hypothetical protein